MSRLMSAFGGGADIPDPLQCPLMTQSGHCRHGAPLMRWHAMSKATEQDWEAFRSSIGTRKRGHTLVVSER